MVRLFLLAIIIYFSPFHTVLFASPNEEGLHLRDVLQKTLELNSQVLIQKQQQNISAGDLLVEQGVFDSSFLFTSRFGEERTPLTKSASSTIGIPGEYKRTIDQTLSLRKFTPYGISFGPALSFSRLENNYDQTTAATLADLSFSLNVKLLKGFGEKASGADKLAAEKAVDVAESTLYHTISAQVLESCQGYWDYSAAALELQILEDAVKKATERLQDIRLLVEKEEAPASELYQLEANRAAKIADKYAGEQKFIASRFDLGVRIGLPQEELDTIPLPETTEFLTVTPNLDKTTYEPKQFLVAANVSRNDLRASRLTQKYNDILLKAFENGILPELDLQARIGYKGLDEGDSTDSYLSSLDENTEWPDWFVGLNFSYQLGNQSNRGELLKQQSVYRQSRINTQDLLKRIHSNVRVALKGLINSSLALESVERSATFYETAVAKEEVRYKMGMATILDILNMEDRYRESQLRAVEARKAYLNALVRLSFESGTIMSINDGKSSVNFEKITGL